MGVVAGGDERVVLDKTRASAAKKDITGALTAAVVVTVISASGFLNAILHESEEDKGDKCMFRFALRREMLLGNTEFHA